MLCCSTGRLQAHLEAAALARCAVDTHGAAHALDQALHDGQADARAFDAFGLGAQPVEGFEQVGHLLCVQAAAGGGRARYHPSAFGGASTHTCPPWRLNLMALLSWLMSSWRSRVGSARDCPAAGCRAGHRDTPPQGSPRTRRPARPVAPVPRWFNAAARRPGRPLAGPRGRGGCCGRCWTSWRTGPAKYGPAPARCGSLSRAANRLRARRCTAQARAAAAYIGRKRQV